MEKLKTVPYEKKFGEFEMPAGAEERLRALSLEEQAALFTVHITGTFYTPHDLSLFEASDVKAVIVRDGIIVGAMISNAYGQPYPSRIGEEVCTWDASDNNGAGYKCREDYATLFLLPADN